MAEEPAPGAAKPAGDGRIRWLDYREWRGPLPSSVAGDLRVLPSVAAPHLGGRDRHVLALLPQGALDAGRRYPVLYMHDGQNLFDTGTSFAGEWRVDETMATLRSEGIEAIVVGIPNGGGYRFEEYTPYPSPPPASLAATRLRIGPRLPNGGKGAAYVRFLVESVKPAVDAAFPTLPEPAATGIMGSSLGGLISLWALAMRPDVFGFAGAMSVAFPPGQEALLDILRAQHPDGRRVYLDVGGREASMQPLDRLQRTGSKAFVRGVERARDALIEAGFRDSVDVHYVLEPGAIHHESAWARRLPEALRFLLGPLRDRTA